MIKNFTPSYNSNFISLIKKVLLLALLIFSVQGCLNLGPSVINENRNSYNSIVQKTNDEQLLLNLVRLKYHDTPFFLEIANITSQHKFSATLNADASLPSSGINIFGFGGGADVSESPVVTYSPLQGHKFIQQFLAKMELKSIFLLYKSGWSVDKIFRLCFEKLGPLNNAPNASGPTPNIAPVYKDFLRVAKILRELEKNNAFNIYMEEVNGKEIMTLQVFPSEEILSKVKNLNKLLKKPPANHIYKLSTDFFPAYLEIETRSLLGIMYYLSHGVEVTEDDFIKGYVTKTFNDEGKLFFWSAMTGDLLKIHVQLKKPENAAVKVIYNGNWYYINKSDLESKSTFSFLAQIFFLQAGHDEKTKPLITIPIGSN